MIGSRDRRALAPIARRRIHSLPLSPVHRPGQRAGQQSHHDPADRRRSPPRRAAPARRGHRRAGPSEGTGRQHRVAAAPVPRPRGPGIPASRASSAPGRADRAGPARSRYSELTSACWLADLASRYPQARLLGVETDHDNAVLARRNLAHLADRCILEEAAVWHRDETLTLAWAPDAWGQAVTGPGDRNGPDSRHRNAIYRRRRRREPAGRLQRARARRLPPGQHRVRLA